VKAICLAPLAVLLTLAAPVPASAQSRINCESRDYQYNFCMAPDGVSRARLVEQRSRAPCIEGRTWGWDRRGIWVSGGCEGSFDYQGFAPVATLPAPVPGGGSMITCESQGYRQDFCAIPGLNGATLVRQLSNAPCIQNQTWGWGRNGIFVSGGCAGEFAIQTGPYQPPRPPSAVGHLVCESEEYRYNFCPAGRIRDAQLVDQRSQAPCIQGQSWGVHRDGIWVDRGCEAEFRIVTR
jgi:hypothetical protein